MKNILNKILYAVITLSLLIGPISAFAYIYNPTGSGGGGGTIGGSILSNQVAFGTGVNAIGGSNNFTTDGSNIQAYSAGNGTFLVSPLTNQFALGYYTGGGIGTHLIMDDNLQTFRFDTGSSTHILADGANKYYFIGDDGTFGNKTYFAADDFNQTAISSGDFFHVQNSAGGLSIATNNNLFVVGIGDVQNNQNGTNLLVHDGNKFISAVIPTGGIGFYVENPGHSQVLFAEPTTYTARLGDINSSANKTLFTVNDNAHVISATLDEFFTVQNLNLNSFFKINIATGFYGIGDIEDQVNKTKLILDDSALRTDLYTQDLYVRGYNNNVGIFSEITNTYSDVKIGDGSGAYNNILISAIDSNKEAQIQLSDTFSTFDVKRVSGQHYFQIDNSGAGVPVLSSGDLDLAFNHTTSVLDDIAKTVTNKLNGIYSVQREADSEPILYTDTVNRIFAGGDTLLMHGGCRFAVIDTALTQDFACPLGVVRLGDPDNGGNRVQELIDDLNKLITLDTRDGISRIGDFNGIGLGAYFETVNSTGMGQVYRHGGIVDDRIDIQAYGTTRNLTNRDYLIRIGTSSVGAATMNLPTGTNSPEGQTFVFIDAGNSASGNNITIDAGGGSIIRGRHDGVAVSAQTLVIVQDGQAVTLKKVNSATWVIESET